MKLTKNTEITVEIARKVNALPAREQQAVVDSLSIKQAEALFGHLLKF